MQAKRQTFSCKYYCRDSKKNKQGMAPVELSIIINQERVFVTLPRKMSPKDFEKAVTSRSNNDTKQFLSLFETKVNNAVTEIITRNETLTAHRVKDYVLGNVCHSYTLSRLINEHMTLLNERTRNEISLDTFRRYKITYEALLRHIGDKPITEINTGDMLSFKTWVLSGHDHTTAYGWMARCKTLFKFAIDNQWLTYNPMNGVRLPKSEKKIEILSEDEYKAIRDKRFDIPRLEKVRKLFVLACNCGLAYSDLMLLRPEDVMRKDDIMYINKQRKKTGVEYTAVVLEDAVDIIPDVVSFKMSNQRLNSYLKEIEDLCNIKHRLTMHKARHYYITTLIRRGINVEIVRQCAGHAKLSMTQKYLHIVNDDVINAFK